ncbi:MAG: hypothetical protein Fur0010_28610 [Bdellovibrio sp.]
MIKQFLIVFLLIAAAKTGFAQTPNCQNNESEQITIVRQIPIVDIRNPTR